MTPEEFEHIEKMIAIYNNLLKIMYDKDDVAHDNFYGAIQALEEATGLSLTGLI